MLKFSDLIKDVLVPIVSNEIQPHSQHRPANMEKITMEALEQANLVLLSNLQKKYVAFIHKLHPEKKSVILKIQFFIYLFFF